MFLRYHHLSRVLIRVVINLGVITLANGPRLLTPLEVHGGGGGELLYCSRAAAQPRPRG